MEKVVDYGGVFGALTRPLHSAWIAKLDAYGIQIEALEFLYDYMSNGKQRVKINVELSSWKDIEYIVLQGSILGPLLFNMHLSCLRLLPWRLKNCALCGWH